MPVSQEIMLNVQSYLLTKMDGKMPLYKFIVLQAKIKLVLTLVWEDYSYWISIIWNKKKLMEMLKRQKSCSNQENRFIIKRIPIQKDQSTNYIGEWSEWCLKWLVCLIIIYLQYILCMLLFKNCRMQDHILFYIYFF